jgi:hypothetical protein
MKHPRTVASDILAEEKDAVCCFEVIQCNRSDWHTDAFRKRDRSALMAHIRAVRQIVGAAQARH